MKNLIELIFPSLIEEKLFLATDLERYQEKNCNRFNERGRLVIGYRKSHR